MKEPTHTYPVFKGSIPALITPMTPSGEIDYTTFKRLIEWHIQEGSDALVIAGTSGESATLSFEEHPHLVQLAVEYAQGRLPIIAGVGANSTKEAIFLSEKAAQAGAVAGLSVVPYYNKPSQEGLFQHFKTIAENTALPTILYNVPGRTVTNMSNETIVRLAQVPGIIGIKDATGDIARVGQLVAQLPTHFQLFSGDDPTAAALILLGGQANISVTANIAPRRMRELCHAALAGQVDTVRRLNAELAELHTAMFIDANPIPVKYALSLLGFGHATYRLPLCPLSSAHQQYVSDAMQRAGLLT